MWAVFSLSLSLSVAVLVGLAAVEVARLVIDVAPFDGTSIAPVLFTLENRISHRVDSYLDNE